PPAISYMENFIGLPVGQVVPVGAYDMQRAAWVPEHNGVVIEVVSVTAGMADLDLDGDGPADPGGYAGLGIDDDERTELANLYTPGTELWRVELEHFSSWDSNLGWSPPPDAGPPPPEGPDSPSPDPNPCETGGSILECQGQIMGERLPIAGTPLSLNYRSDRVPGRTSAYTLTLPIANTGLAASLAGITTRLVVGGRLIQQDFPIVPDQIYTVTWDGEDAYGRRLQGPTPAELCVGYEYPALYSDVTGNLDLIFGYNGNGDLITTGGSRDAAQATFWRCYADAPVGGGVIPANAAEAPRALSPVGRYNLGTWDARAGSPGLGGWTLDIHHTLAPEAGILYLGNGRRRDGTESYNTVIQTVAGGGGTNALDIPATQAAIATPTDVAIAADGTIYVASVARVLRVDPQGVLRPFAGTGVAGNTGDGGPALAAQLGGYLRLAVGPDESLYISDRSNRRIRRVDPSGTIEALAGNGTTSHTGDGNSALLAGIGTPEDIVVGPDGTLYIAADRRIRRVTPGGEITTFAGGSCSTGPVDGKIATADCICDAEGIALSEDGAVYVTMNPLGCGGARYVYRIGMDNRFELVAGGGSPADGVGDGLVGPDVVLWQARDVEVSREGIVYVSDHSGSASYPGSGHRVRVIGHDGIVTTLAGDGYCEEIGDDGPAAAACLRRPMGMAVGQDHALYIATGLGQNASRRRVRRISSAGLGWSASGRVVASRDHRELYVFSAEGRHEGTLDALTGTTMWTFGYDAEGRLLTATDRYSRVTTIGRNASGEAETIVSPDGQTTTLSIPDGGYLEAVANPEGETHQFGYSADGLLESRITPRGDQFDYTYDGGGRLVLATDPEGGSKSFEREQLGPRAYEVTMTTELGRESSYLVEDIAFGEQHRVNTHPDGTMTDVLVGNDGVTTVTYPNGTVAVTEQVADPRFGMQAPVLALSTVTTPDGLQRVTTKSRVVTLDVEGDPLSMTALTETQTVNGRTWTWDFDAATDTATRTSPEGRTFTIALDSTAALDVVQSGTLAPLDFDYDAFGRTTTATWGVGATARVTDFTYDASGFLDVVLDPANQTHGYTRDLVGRVEVKIRPDAEATTYSYDENGNLVAVTPPDQPAHGFDYDASDQLVSYDPPLLPDVPLPSTGYEYTDDHRVDLVTRADGQTIASFYDAASGRLDAVTTPRGTYSIGYDTSGRVELLVDPDGGSITYDYDGALRVSETRSAGIPASVIWSYDADFRIVSQVVNGVLLTAFTYDDDGLVMSAGDEVLTLDPATGLAAVVSLESSTTDITYDEFATPATVSYEFGGTTVYDADYGIRDSLGRITTLTETILGTTRVIEYGYDLVGRLETVTEDSVLAASYTYDENGNRLSVVEAAGTLNATYDAQDRLLTHGALAFSYSEAGERATRTDTVASTTTLYEYDVLGALRSVELPDTTLIEYDIDALGRRIGKRVDGNLVQGWVYADAHSIVAELDDAGIVVSHFVWGMRGNVPDYMVRGGTTYRLVTDQVGTVRLVVDASTGVVAQRLDYDSWGRVTFDSNPGFQPFGYAGGIYDADTGLVRFGARDYDADVAQWTAKDPIGFGGGQGDLYGYVGADPINRVDPSGLAPWDPFRTPQQAARDFCRIYGDRTFQEGREYGTGVFRKCDELPEGTYGPEYCYWTYRGPTPGTHEEVRVLSFPEDVTSCHTHPPMSSCVPSKQDRDKCPVAICVVCYGEMACPYARTKKKK
ncbi:MAG: hypothetical protein JKY37_02300, partial [Nannocystaceae bacterium]|nr:hypothetical protein [Nannocystaceae bacterium]